MMNINKVFVFLFVFLFHLISIAQIDIKNDSWKTYPPSIDTLNKANTSKKPVPIVQDVRILSLVAKHILINEEHEKMEGYRIQLFSGSGNTSKQEGQEIKVEFMKKYPEIPTYILWEEPNFKIKIGNYRTRMDALKFFNTIINEYPGAFIVRDEINFPDLD